MILEARWTNAIHMVIGHCMGDTHYKSTLYPTDDVLETMFKDVLQLTSEEDPEFLLLFKRHLSYIRNDIANKRGKYSTDIRRAFFSTLGIKKPHKHMMDTEKDKFIRSCKELRELKMEIEDGKIIYNWHRGTDGETFNSDLLVVVLGLTFASSGFNIEETNKTTSVGHARSADLHILHNSKNHCSIRGCKLEQRVPRKHERLSGVKKLCVEC